MKGELGKKGRGKEVAGKEGGRVGGGEGEKWAVKGELGRKGGGKEVAGKEGGRV